MVESICLEVEANSPFDSEVLGIGAGAIAVSETPYKSNVADLEDIREKHKWTKNKLKEFKEKKNGK